MNILTSNKFVATTLIFMLSITLASLPLSAKKRQGSTVVVTLIDGSEVKGELLAVKTDVLLVYDRDAGTGGSIDLRQVDQVKVFKKSKILASLAIGLGIGLALGLNPEKNVHIDDYWLKISIPSVLIGGILGVGLSIPEKFFLAGESSRIVRLNLDCLRVYAREKEAERPADPEDVAK